MPILNNYKHNITAIKFSLFKLQKVNKIVSRSMFKLASHQGVNIRVIRPALHNAIDQRGYAAVGGRSQIPKEHDTFDKKTWRNFVANHMQLITDFNLIYENPRDIKLYQIGTLFSNSSNPAENVSYKENYKFEHKEQKLRFFEEVIPVKQKVFMIKQSQMYFDKPEIKEAVENRDEYKKLFNTVLQELKDRNIKVRIAATLEEQNLTGLNVLLKTKNTTKSTPLMDSLDINNDEKT